MLRCSIIYLNSKFVGILSSKKIKKRKIIKVNKKKNNKVNLVGGNSALNQN